MDTEAGVSIRSVEKFSFFVSVPWKDVETSWHAVFGDWKSYLGLHVGIEILSWGFGPPGPLILELSLIEPLI